MKLYVNFICTYLIMTIVSLGNVNSQEIQQKFILDGETQTTIPFVNVYLKNGTHGWITDLNGIFRYKTEDINDTDIITFSAIGYKTFELPYFAIKDCTLINLQQKVFTLNEVKVKTRNYKRGRLGKRRKSSIDMINFGVRSDHIGLKEEATFIPNEKSYDGIFDEVVVFIKKGSPTPFNVNLHEVNLANGSPGRIINDDPIYAIASNNLTWLKIPVKNQNISIPKTGFFISINWQVDSIYWAKADTLIIENQQYISRGVVVGDDFTKTKNRWIKDTDGNWKKCYVANEESLSQNNNYSSYQSIASYCTVLLDKESLKNKKVFLKSQQILSRKKTQKKLNRKIKQDIYTYPQHTPSDLLKSIVKAEKAAHFDYALSNLYFYRKQELDSLLSNNTLPKFSNIDPTKPSLMDSLSVTHNTENTYNLEYNNKTIELLYENGLWYISPIMK